MPGRQSTYPLRPFIATDTALPQPWPKCIAFGGMCDMAALYRDLCPDHLTATYGDAWYEDWNARRP